MIEFELDNPLLTQDGIQLSSVFMNVIELNSSSMIDELIMIEMLILLIDSFGRGVAIYERMRVLHKIRMHPVSNTSQILLVLHRPCSLPILNLQRRRLRSELIVIVLYTDEFILFVHYQSHASSN